MSADCWFANDSYNWGDNGCFKFKTNRPSSAYVIKDIYGNSVGSGTTNGDTNQENQVCFTIRDGSNYSLFIDDNFACDKSPNVPNMEASSCQVEKSNLPPTGTTKFKANLTNCNSNACTYYLKKDGSTIVSNSYGNYIEPTVTGPGTYTLHLLSEDAPSACSVTITEVSPATNCQFANSTYTYGEDAYFKTKVTANNANWSIKDPNGNVVHSGSGLTQNDQDWQTNFRATIGGEYSFYLNGEKACTANLNLNMPKATNCKFDNSNIADGQNTEFRFKIESCKNNLCSYDVKLDGSSIDYQSNIGEGDRNKNVNTAGEYVVWLNGVETDCKATLSVVESGSLACSMAESLLIGEQWQKIKVTSTRPNTKYDIWIDGSIGKNSNGNDMTGIDINENSTSDVGGITCETSGQHSYKITANGKTKTLCEGTFNCVSVPKVDCYFLKNSDWSAVSGSVLPKTPLQFCASKASANKQTTLTGQDKNGNINKGDFGLSKDNVTCHYFEVPSNDGTYTFKLSADGEEACKSNPVLVVKKPENMITLVYQGSLTTIEAGSWLIYSTHQYSGVMRCKSTSGEVNITVDGAIKTITETLNSVEGTAPRTDVSVEVVIPVGKSIQCYTDW